MQFEPDPGLILFHRVGNQKDVLLALNMHTTMCRCIYIYMTIKPCAHQQKMCMYAYIYMYRNIYHIHMIYYYKYIYIY